MATIGTRHLVEVRPHANSIHRHDFLFDLDHVVVVVVVVVERTD